MVVVGRTTDRQFPKPLAFNIRQWIKGERCVLHICSVSRYSAHQGRCETLFIIAVISGHQRCDGGIGHLLISGDDFDVVNADKARHMAQIAASKSISDPTAVPPEATARMARCPPAG